MKLKPMQDVIVGLMAIFGVWETWAQSAEKQYWEYKTNSYIVRYTEGPGEMASIGSYAMHIYDSNGVEWITGIIRPRDGVLVKSWMTEKTETGFRIWLWMQSVGSGAYGSMELLECEGKTLWPISLPEPEQAMLQGYMGHDEYSIVKGRVYRQFPLYREGDSNAKPTGGRRCLELDMKKKKWRLSSHRIE